MTIKRIKKDRAEFEVGIYSGEMNFEEMNRFVHLGALITSKCEEVKEIDAKLSKANRISIY